VGFQESGIDFDSYLLDVFENYHSYDYLIVDYFPNEISFGKKRLLSVKKHLILAAHSSISFLINSGDVLHSFAVPSLGIKVDAVPGRVNTFYLEGAKVGYYYGQCSELCGFGHGFMPIVIEMVDVEEEEEEEEGEGEEKEKEEV